MDIACDVICDLLPLYVDKKTSEASDSLVLEHISHCESCSARLEKLRSGHSSSGRRSSSSRAKRRKLTGRLAVIFAVVALVSWLWAFLFNPVWLTADEAVVRVEEAEHGAVRFVLYDYVKDHSGTNWENNVGHVWNTSRFDKLLTSFDLMVQDNRLVPLEPKEYVIRGVIINDKGGVEAYDPELADLYGVTENMTEKNHWYENVYEGTLETLLWDGGQRAPEEGTVEQDKLLQLNFIGTLALTVLLIVGYVVLKKNPIRKYLPGAAVFTGCVAVSQLLITGGRFVTVCVASEPYPTLKWIYIVGVSLALTILCFANWFKLKRQETKG